MKPLLDGKITLGDITKWLFVLWLALGFYLLQDAVLPMKGLPSPVYGGDYYYQQGQIYHYVRGGGLLDSSSLESAPFSYAPLYAWLVTPLASVLGVLEGMKWAALIFYVVSMVLWYWALREILGDAKALVALLLINFLAWHPIFKYTEFGYAVILPLFLLALHRAQQDSKYWLAAGVLLGIMAYTHGVLLIGASILALAVVWRQPKNIFYLAVTLLFFIPILFNYLPYGFEKKFPRYKMDFPDFSRIDVWIWFLQYAAEKVFLEWNGWILLLLLYFGLKKDEYIWWLVGALVAVFSFVITEPLLHMNFFPTYMLQLVFFPVFVITILKFSKLNHIRLWLIVAVLLMGLNYLKWEEKVQDPVFQVAYTPLPPYLLSLQAYLLENTSVDDVVLTAKELGFAVNALSGDKLLTGRWAHNTNTPYVDMPLRDTEAAIILYGNNLSKRLELLKKWNVSYIYADIYWPQVEFVSFSIPTTAYEAANIVYDPLLTTNPSYKILLQQDGIHTFDVDMWLDPTARFPYIRTFLTTVVSWENYQFTGYGVWKSDLDQYLEPVWVYYYQGQPIAALYKIKGGTG